MKILIFGLGNFGHSLALSLTETNNEVIGVDLKMDKVELLKDRIAHAICMDSTNEMAYEALPLSDADLAIVAIGENEGAAIITTAILKKRVKCGIISRSLSPIHDTVLQAMGVDQIVHPEQEAAEKLTRKINFKHVVDNFKIDDKYSISEIKSRPEFDAKSVEELNFRVRFNLNIITILRRKEKSNILGRKIYFDEALGLPKPDTVLHANDILVVFGENRHIKRFCEGH